MVAVKRHTEVNTLEKLAGEEGFEPSLRDPESRVLPLDDSPATEALELKSSPLGRLLNTTGPLNLPQKTRETGQLLQSQLPNPPICDLSLARLLLKYQVIALTLSPHLALYRVTDNANETSSIVASAPPILRETVSPPSPLTWTRPHTAPFTLPEYVTEVAPC